MRKSADELHRIVVHNPPRHNEIWYSDAVPEVGKLLFHHGQECEVVSVRMENASYVLELSETDGGPDTKVVDHSATSS